MKKTFFAKCLTIITGLTVMMAAAAWAKPQLAVTMEAAREIRDHKSWSASFSPASSAVSGDVLLYTITYKNSGNEPATNATLNNPMSPGTSYIDNSAGGKNADISFSIDGGKTYKKPSCSAMKSSKLTESRKHTARPEEYTHVRWVIPSVASGSSGTVQFKVRIK